jgi:hypothetical protein
MAWVFQHLHEHLVEGGSFKTLIYKRLGYSSDAYEPLYMAGGFAVSSALSDYQRIGMRYEPASNGGIAPGSDNP